MATTKIEKVSLNRGTTAAIPIRFYFNTEPPVGFDLRDYISQLTIKPVKEDWDFHDSRATIIAEVDLEPNLVQIASNEYMWVFELTAKQTYIPVGDYYADVELLTKPAEEEEENSLTNCRLGTFQVEVVGGPNNRAVRPSLNGTGGVATLSNQVRFIFDDQQVKTITILAATAEINVLKTPPTDGRRYLFMWDLENEEFVWDPEYYEIREDLTSQIDGETFTFTYSIPIEEKYGMTHIIYDGKTYFPGEDYEIDYENKTITFPLSENLAKEPLGAFDALNYSWQEMYYWDSMNISGVKLKFSKEKLNVVFGAATTQYCLFPVECQVPNTYYGLIEKLGDTTTQASYVWLGFLQIPEDFFDVLDTSLIEESPYGTILFNEHAHPNFPLDVDGQIVPSTIRIKGPKEINISTWDLNAFNLDRDITIEYPVKKLILVGRAPAELEE